MTSGLLIASTMINRQGSCLETLFAEEIPNEQDFITKILFTLVLFGVFGFLEKTFSVFPLKRRYGSYCHCHRFIPPLKNRF